MPELTRKPKKPWYKRISRLILIFVVLIIVVGIVLTVRGLKERSKITNFEYLRQSATAEIGTVSKTISTQGEIVPDERIKLSFLVPGKLTEVNYVIGDYVEKGDILMKIDGGSFAAKKDQELVAPIDGRIVDIKTVTDTPVALEEAVVEMVSRGTHISLSVSDRDVIHLRKDQSATIRILAYVDERTFPGTVTFVDVQKRTAVSSVSEGRAGDSTGSGYTVNVAMKDVPAEIAGVLGLEAQVEIAVDRKENVLALELGAVQYDVDDKPFVYVLPELTESFIMQAQQVADITELLEKKTIEVGFVGDEKAEVLSGLQAGESVLVYVPQKEFSPSF
ncbi:MAG: hypothetical protein A3F54_04630 [Candidatus Kerfeldbacteria bacterium RIFCSPHIGHO2_12_FULL_48_17]|uniref:Multidrug resistance protein MdtA-like barrel-sandwich hybrid domain-containing protein n=1 Tax=Candidatus Kerfeldbacteria bacterium RIFCSPHIGHO2_12_FULL_48_17 TaxID=1798542 RepID=A0A1G2B418_9BACT|nr:MAG: hypothetical protein A3F54_04630 [Candidatus Kerfeldbacteria bacterium RIFCSPHIGHO2_12_FULL_48_17]